jgi:hypothetical protein
MTLFAKLANPANWQGWQGGKVCHINPHTILNCVGLDFAHKKTPTQTGGRAGASTTQQGERHATQRSISFTL